MDITITEALAEVPTISKRIAKKQQFVLDFLYRPSAIRDAHEKDGGSAELIKRELQGIADLETRLIAIRSGIAKANSVTTITIGETTRTITDWLTWRREVSEGQRSRLSQIASSLRAIRAQAQKQGTKVSDQNTDSLTEIVVNVNEKDLSEQIEALETTLGALDGQLSLKNATVTISFTHDENAPVSVRIAPTLTADAVRHARDEMWAERVIDVARSKLPTPPPNKS